MYLLLIHRTQQVNNQEDIQDDDEDDDEDDGESELPVYKALLNYDQERFDPDNRFAVIVDQLVHNAFETAIGSLMILKEMNPRMAATRAQGCLDMFPYIFKDNPDNNFNALRNVTVHRGER